MSRRPGFRAVTAIAAISVALAGCGAVSSTTSPSLAPTAATSTGPTALASAPPSSTASPASGATEPPTCAQATLASMTLQQRVGQLFMIKLPSLEVGSTIRDAIGTWHIGNVWYGRRTDGVASIRSVSDALQALATGDATGGVPLFISANQEGGLVQGLSGPGFATIPSAVIQGTWSIDKLGSQAGIWGSDLGDAGVNVDFAPVADVVPAGTESQNAPIGQLRREYGSTPQAVADHVVAFIGGLHDAGIGTTVKHFPGLGRVAGNTDSTAEVVDNVTTRDDPYLEPFRAAIQDGQTEFVMASLATYTKIDPDHIAAFSHTILTDILRGDLGFDGVIMSDSLSATAVLAWTAGTRAQLFLLAGGDLIVLTPLGTATSMITSVTKRAQAHPDFAAIVDAAALRVLEAKDEAGMLPCS